MTDDDWETLKMILLIINCLQAVEWIGEKVFRAKQKLLKLFKAGKHAKK